MKSVKQMSKISGVSIRTLRYYDEIDLLKPAFITEGGYRQYGNVEIQKLQKILLLKEVGFSLFNIKQIMNNKILNSEKDFYEKQQQLLILKKKRLEDLISLINSMIKGELNMCLEKFSNDEINKTFNVMIERLNSEEKNSYIQKNGGSIEIARNNFNNSFISYDGDLKYFLGNKDMSEMLKEAPTLNEIEKYRDKLTSLYQELGMKTGRPIDDSILSIIGKIRIISISMFPVEKKDELFCEMAELYAKNIDARQEFDKLYGRGTAQYYLKCEINFMTRNS